MTQRIQLLHGDCLQRLRAFEDESFAAFVGDPPYALTNYAAECAYLKALRSIFQCMDGSPIIRFAKRTIVTEVPTTAEVGLFLRGDIFPELYSEGFVVPIFSPWLPGGNNRALLRFNHAGEPMEIVLSKTVSIYSTLGFGGLQLGSITKPEGNKYEVPFGDQRLTLWLPQDLFSGLPKLPRKGFMGKEWDSSLPPLEIWRECYRTLKPGGLIRQFSATRTFHRLCKSFRDLGFVDIHVKAWCQGQGFAKGKNLSAAIDKRFGLERKIVGYKKGVGGENLNDIVNGKAVRKTTDVGGKGVGAYGTGAKQVIVDVPITEPASEEAKIWDGYNVALKPGWEPIVCARRPHGS